MADQMTIGCRTYEIIGTARYSDDVVEQALKAGASCGEDDGNHILEFQDQIPADLEDIIFVFPSWPNTYYTGWGYCNGYSTISRGDSGRFERGCIQSRHGCFPPLTRVLRRIH